jgi:hypothetical protein
MKLESIIEDLRAYCPTLEKRVFGVAEYAVVDETASADLPCAFVLPLQETTEEPQTFTRYRQSVKFEFAVVLMMGNAADEQGLPAWDLAVELKKEVFQALLGKEIDRDPIQYEGLSIVDLSRARLIVQLEFSIEFDITDEETRHGLDIAALGPLKTVMTDVDLSRPDGQIEAKVKIDFDSTGDTE